MRVIHFLAFAAALIVASGCSGGGEPPSEAGAEAASLRDGACPVTLPNGSVPEDARDWGPESSYGNGKLWTQFWPYNVVIATPDFVGDDGSVRMKWPWWRGDGGELRIEGHRLDGDAPPIGAEIPPHYGLSGFQPTAIVFPMEGCWQVTGRAGDASLTFVTLVLKASRYSP